MTPSGTARGQDGRWVGAALTRKEDRRLLQGRGRFVGDMTRAGMLYAAFVRSPFPAAGVTAIDTSAALASPGVAAVFTAAGLGEPYLLATLERDEFVPAPMPLLAGDQVRFAGEPVAVVLAGDGYLAEDAAELVAVDWAPGPAVAGLAAAQADGAPQVHPGTSGNCLVDLLMFNDERLGEIFAGAAVVVGGEFTSARLAAMPLEGRACLAEWDDRDGQLVLHVSTQVPHQVRSGVAQALGIPERTVRVIAPDVGGGFGLKCVVGREEVVVAAAALRLRRPVRWTEDRHENLSASFHGHEQRHRVRAAFDGEGRMLGLDAEIDCDVGAYSAYPFTCAVEPLMAASELPGIYKVPAYRARAPAVVAQVRDEVHRLPQRVSPSQRVRHAVQAERLPYEGPGRRVAVGRQGVPVLGDRERRRLLPEDRHRRRRDRRARQPDPERLRAQPHERKIYIRADARAKWARVENILDQFRAAGVTEVGFLADRRNDKESAQHQCETVTRFGGR